MMCIEYIDIAFYMLYIYIVEGCVIFLFCYSILFSFFPVFCFCYVLNEVAKHKIRLIVMCILSTYYYLYNI